MNAQRPLRPAPTGSMVTVHEAKTHLSRLLARVETGEEIVIARGSVPVARIVPFAPATLMRRTPGRLAHELPQGASIIGPEFWEPLSEAEIGIGGDDSLDREG